VFGYAPDGIKTDPRQDPELSHLGKIGPRQNSQDATSEEDGWFLTDIFKPWRWGLLDPLGDDVYGDGVKGS
jgi:hypothetical protein